MEYSWKWCKFSVHSKHGDDSSGQQSSADAGYKDARSLDEGSVQTCGVLTLPPSRDMHHGRRPVPKRVRVWIIGSRNLQQLPKLVHLTPGQRNQGGWVMVTGIQG